MSETACFDLIQKGIHEVLRPQVLWQFFDIAERAFLVGRPEISIIGILNTSELDEP